MPTTFIIPDSQCILVMTDYYIFCVRRTTRLKKISVASRSTIFFWRPPELNTIMHVWDMFQDAPNSQQPHPTNKTQGASLGRNISAHTIIATLRRFHYTRHVDCVTSTKAETTHSTGTFYYFFFFQVRCITISIKYPHEKINCLNYVWTVLNIILLLHFWLIY